MHELRTPAAMRLSLCRLRAHLCPRSRFVLALAISTSPPRPLRRKHANGLLLLPVQHLVAVLLELLGDLGVDVGILLGVDELLLESTLALVVGGALDFSPLLEPV